MSSRSCVLSSSLKWSSVVGPVPAQDVNIYPCMRHVANVLPPFFCSKSGSLLILRYAFCTALLKPGLRMSFATAHACSGQFDASHLDDACIPRTAQTTAPWWRLTSTTRSDGEARYRQDVRCRGCMLSGGGDEGAMVGLGTTMRKGTSSVAGQGPSCSVQHQRA